MSKTTITILSLALLFTSCTSESEASSADANNSPNPAATEVATEVVAAEAEMQAHDAMCGCSIEGIGKCGNYIMVDDEYVTLIWPELGVMEYCKDKKNGAKIEVAGEMVDGKYVATAYRRVN
ncbi:MAG: hypothetical protein ACYTG5_19515 [Planctomycetota bacterium]|jgi:hypothetical protein